MSIDPEKIANEIMRVEIDHATGGTSDNIAVMLCSFFEKSIHHPDDRTLDEYDCWTQWAVDQVKEIEETIASIIANAMKNQ